MLSLFRAKRFLKASILFFAVFLLSGGVLVTGYYTGSLGSVYYASSYIARNVVTSMFFMAFLLLGFAGIFYVYKNSGDKFRVFFGFMIVFFCYAAMEVFSFLVQ